MYICHSNCTIFCNHPTSFSALTALLKTQSRIVLFLTALFCKYQLDMRKTCWIRDIFCVHFEDVLLLIQWLTICDWKTQVLNVSWRWKYCQYRSKTGYTFSIIWKLPWDYFPSVNLWIFNMYMYIDLHLIHSYILDWDFKDLVYCMPSLCSMWLKWIMTWF